jgi:hypothetical protein
MKIKYIHVSDPTIEKIHDTEKSFKSTPRVFRTQGEFDAFTLQLFERDKENGIVLSYEVIDEGVSVYGTKN